MKPLTKEWVKKAEGDWNVANREWRTKKPVYDAICFHAQQCAEKYLKAVMQESEQSPPKTHDLVKIAAKLKKPENLALLEKELAALSNYAVAARYPGENATPAEAKYSLNVAAKVRKIVLDHLGRNHGD